MSNNLHRSYRDVFVVNNPALLQSGDSNALAVGQIGAFEYDPLKDQVAMYGPNANYAKVRAFQIIQGTPELPTNLLAAVANETDKSKPIKGRNITNWQGRKAQRGQNQKVTIGYDGFDTTKTLTGKCEETKMVFLKLSGGPIDMAFHTDGRGLVRQYSVYSGCCDDCGDDCANVSAERMADDLVQQIINDPIINFGSRPGTPVAPGSPVNRLVTARKIIGTADATPDATCTRYLLSICDEGDNTALGRVQAQYAGKIITRFSRTGSTSVYELIQDSTLSAPTAFSNAGITLISDCPTCPSGYTAVAEGYAYAVLRQDAGTSGALTTATTDYGIVSPETITRVSYTYGQSTYIIVSSTEITAAVGTDILNSLGRTRNSCVLTTPSTTAWVSSGTYNRFAKSYNITVADSICGTSRLTELQEAYPNLVITQVSGGTGDECIHQFTTTVLSNCVAPGCPPDAPQWIKPDAFQGVEWEEVPFTYTDTYAVGVMLESAYVDRVTNECAYDYWKYDAEPVIIEISQHSQDYNDTPTMCDTEWPVTEVQAVKIPIGVGSYVREQEAFFKGYDRKYRDCNPIVRELQDSILQTDPNKYYDQYTLSFKFDYHEHWFTEKFTDSYKLEIYVPEGTGKNLESVINAYVSTLPQHIDPVVL